MSLKVSIGESGRHSVTLEKDRKKRSKVGQACNIVAASSGQFPANFRFSGALLLSLALFDIW